MSNRTIAKDLARKHGVEVRQARYREDGQWYHHLEYFPAAFFDQNGYIVFKTKEEYQNCPYLQLEQDVNVTKKGISSIPGYILFKAKEESVIKENTEKYETQKLTPAEKPTEFLEFTEGAIEEMVVELRKRDPHLKSSAIQAYGTVCQICGFDFSEIYGELGKGYIELHHKRPLSESIEIQQTTLEDVAIVCSNCHSMLHRNGKNALPVQALIEIIQMQKVARGQQHST